MSNNSLDAWRETNRYSGCQQFDRTLPDYYGRATVADRSIPEFGTDISASVSAWVVQDSNMRQFYNTRSRARPDTRNWVGSQRQMDILSSPWQMPDIRPEHVMIDSRMEPVKCKEAAYPPFCYMPIY